MPRALDWDGIAASFLCESAHELLDWLYTLCSMSSYTIAELVGVSHQSVLNRLRYEEIERKPATAPAGNKNALKDWTFWKPLGFDSELAMWRYYRLQEGISADRILAILRRKLKNTRHEKRVNSIGRFIITARMYRFPELRTRKNKRRKKVKEESMEEKESTRAVVFERHIENLKRRRRIS